MTYLLDTHYIIWSLSEIDKISKKVQEILSEPDNTVVVSTISFWEISLKKSMGKLDFGKGMPEDIPNSCVQMGFEIMQLSAEDASTFHNLSGEYHKDPFDRMLIWQAINNNYILISDDKNVKKYTSEGLKVIW